MSNTVGYLLVGEPLEDEQSCLEYQHEVSMETVHRHFTKVFRESNVGESDPQEI